MDIPGKDGDSFPHIFLIIQEGEWEFLWTMKDGFHSAFRTVIKPCECCHDGGRYTLYTGGVTEYALANMGFHPTMCHF